MRAGSRSRTSDWVAALRALYSEVPDELRLARDDVAVSLLSPGLAALVRGLTVRPGVARAAHRLIGATTLGLSYGVPLRTIAIDEAIVRSVTEGTRQLVLLGAGLDARAFRMPELDGVTVFEVDHPSTQAFKRERTQGLVPLAERVVSAAIDFERDRLGEVLPNAGFDRAKPSVWVWEGVTMYLSHDAIDATLDSLEALAAPGSRLAVTYLLRGFGGVATRRLGEVGATLIGEHLRTQQSPDELSARLVARDFVVEADESALDWATRWPAADARRVREYERLAVARRRPVP